MIMYERTLCISLISEFHILYFINYERRKIVQNHVIDVDYRKGRKKDENWIFRKHGNRR